MGKILLMLPEDLHERLKQWKKMTGTCVTNYCYQAIARKAVQDGILRIECRELKEIEKPIQEMI